MEVIYWAPINIPTVPSFKIWCICCREQKEGTARGRGVAYVRVGNISIVNLAYLAVLTMFPTSACLDALRAFSLDIVISQTLLYSINC